MYLSFAFFQGFLSSLKMRWAGKYMWHSAVLVWLFYVLEKVANTISFMHNHLLYLNKQSLLLLTVNIVLWGLLIVGICWQVVVVYRLIYNRYRM